MKWFRNFEIQARFSFGLGAVGCLLLLVTIAAHLESTANRAAQQSLFTNNLATVADLAGLRSNLNAERLGLAAMLATPRSEWGVWRQMLDENAKEDDAILQRLRARWRDDPQATATLHELIAVRDAFTETRERQMLMLNTVRTSDARNLFSGEQYARNARMQELARQLEARETAAARNAVLAVEGRVSRFGSIVLGLSAAALLTVAGLMLGIRRTIRLFLSDRRQSAEAARVSEARYRSLFDNMHDGCAYCRLEASEDPPRDFVFLDVNGALENLTGFRHLRGQKASEAMPVVLANHPNLLEVFARVVRTGQLEEIELHLERKDAWFAVSVHAVGDGCFVAVFKNQTDQRQAEAELRRRNRELMLLNRAMTAVTSEAAPPVVLEIACRELAMALDLPLANASLLDDDKAAVTIVAEYGDSTQPTVVGVHIPVRDNPVVQRMMTQKQPIMVEDAPADPQMKVFHEYIRRRQGVSMLMLPLVVENEAIGAIVLGSRERRRFPDADIKLAWSVATEVALALARARLIESQRRLTIAIEQTPESIVITDAHGCILYVNPAFERSTGFTRHEAIGNTPRLFRSGRQDAAFYRRMWTKLAAGEVWDGRIVNKKKDGTLFTVYSVIAPMRDANGQIVDFIASQRDISRELQLEQQFLHAQKMEAFGQLAGGVAHDFNNILAAMLMHLSLLQTEPGQPARTRSALRELEGNALRAASLTRQLLTFSRRQTPQKQPLDLGHVVADLLKMLRRLLGEQIEVVYERPKAALPIEGDAGMIEQVVMNLCVNARDAMPQGGRLTIDTRLIAPPAATAKDSSPPMRFVCLTVTDTGCGMDSSTLKRLFEPFFTTKGVGKGTGLGLATAYGIVQQHNGRIEVDSLLGSGSTFRVFIPALDRLVPPEAQDAALDVSGGTEHILLVEDEPAVRQMAAECLRRFGYQVVEAVNGIEAMLRWEEREHRFDLLLTDMVMPGGVSGMELAEYLKRSKPGLRIVISSGYNAEMPEPAELARRGFACLAKPYEIKRLLELVRQVLDQQQPKTDGAAPAADRT